MESSNLNNATYLQLLKLYAKTVFFYCYTYLPWSKHHSCTETDDAAHSAVLSLVIKMQNTYNFYLVTEVPDHVYVFCAYRLYFADKDIYMIQYFYHKIEIIVCFLIYINDLPLNIQGAKFILYADDTNFWSLIKMKKPCELNYL